MSGAEVLGLISGIISVVDASLEIYNAVKDASGLPPSFRDIASRLPAIKLTLRKALDGLDAGRSDNSVESIRSSLEMCKRKVEELEGIFRSALRPSNAPGLASRISKPLKAMRTIRKADRVTFLKTGIMEDLQVLTASQAFQTATRAQIESLSETVRSGHIRNGSPSFSIRNTGNGKQTIHSGVGTQHTDDGPLFSGVFHGPIYYTRSR